MNILFYFINGILSIILLILIGNTFFGPFLAKQNRIRTKPKVSLLIPARNEEKNIATCLDHLLRQDYANLEIIVLDDQSQDATQRIVKNYVAKYDRISLIEGKPLPDGWTGKNWACHQLAQVVSGEVMIFTDADTQHGAKAVSNTIGWMQTLDLGMLSAFPQQLTLTLSERLIVPVIDFFVYGFLPLWTTYFLKSPAFAAANGQWIAFKKEVYGYIGGHESVKMQVVEDVELNRRAKELGHKTLTTAGTSSVFCRMYHSAKEVWHGFTKNFYGLTGHNTLVFLFIESLLLGCCVLPYLILPILADPEPAFLAIILNTVIRAFLAIRFKHPFIISILFHPIAILYAAIIGFHSLYQFHWGHFQWKGRKIQLS